MNIVLTIVILTFCKWIFHIYIFHYLYVLNKYTASACASTKEIHEDIASAGNSEKILPESVPHRYELQS